MASALNQPGFLTKMVKLIRSSASEREQGKEHSVPSKQTTDGAADRAAFQDRITRMRNDDRVRRREFTYLRKVRAEGMPAIPGALLRPSVFQSSSMFSRDDQTADDRDNTVRKIDAIEAQMTDQWVQLKRSGAATGWPQARNKSSAPIPTPAGKEATAVPDARAQDLDLDFTAMLAEETRTASAPRAEEPVLPDEPMPTEEEIRTSTFRPSRHLTVEMGEHAVNPALQEAAIRFAEGDDESTEAALMAGLESPEAGDETAEACSAALLDLYRATGQQTSFDVVAIEYAQLFGRSAPEWYAVSELTNAKALPATDDASPATAASLSAWECPPLLDLSAAIDLQAVVHRAAGAQLVWGNLESIAPQAVPPLLILFRQWADQPIALHFSGQEALVRVLALATPVQDSTVDPVWWNLRLEAFRVLGMQHAFDEAAMDFCVTYELSPPSWVNPVCTLANELATQPSPLEGAPTLSVGPEAHLPAQLTLTGVLQGDIAEQLAHLRRRTPPGEAMVISCARLVRLDFVAAGCILNWVIAARSDGIEVQFVNVPRLVAAYFDVMGISTQAVVLTGKR